MPFQSATLNCRYLLLSISANCDPVNRLFFLELESLPRSAATGA